MLAYATALELLRHGRPIALLLGVVLTLLAQLALGAEGSTSSRSFVEPSAARAAVLRGVTVTREVGGLETAGPSPAASAARATSASASDELLSGSPGLLPIIPNTTTEGASSGISDSRRDDPTALALAVRASPVPRALVAAIAERHGLDGDRFADVMFCESSLRPDAVGDHGAAVGIAQWHAPTWADATRRYYGVELAPAMRLDPELALEVAAAKWAAEGPWAWTCAK